MNQSKVCFVAVICGLVGVAAGYCGCYIMQSQDVTLYVTAITEPIGTPPTVKMPRAEEQQSVVEQDKVNKVLQELADEVDLEGAGLTLYEIKDGYGAKWNGVRISGSEDIPNFRDQLENAIRLQQEQLKLPPLPVCKEAKQFEEWYKIFNCAAWLFATRKSAGRDIEIADEVFKCVTQRAHDDLEQLNKMLIDGIETGDVEKIAECRIRIDGTEAILREVERIRDTVK